MEATIGNIGALINLGYINPSREHPLQNPYSNYFLRHLHVRRAYRFRAYSLLQACFKALTVLSALNPRFRVYG